MTVRRYYNLKRIATIFCFIIVAACAYVFIGCGSDVDIALTRQNIFLTVGESRDMLPYVVFYGFDVNKTIDVDAANDGILSVDGRIVTALEKGETTLRITAYGKTLELDVAVGHMQSDSLTVYVTDRYQTVKSGDTPHAVTFTAELDDYTDPNTQIEWFADGVSKGTGSSFEYLPDDYGEYTVTAVADGLECNIPIAVYRQTTVSVSIVGSLEQSNGDFSPVAFTARENINTLNPRSVFEWRLNGEAACTAQTFEFTPTAAGEYFIELYCNGEAKSIAGRDGITVKTEGVRTPRGELVFDDEGGVCVKWSDGEYIVRASVYCPDGSRVNIDRSDAQNAYRFERGALKLDDVVDVCAKDPSAYRIEIVAEGKSELTFTQYPEIARSYIEEKVLCRNSFISSESDARMWMREIYAVGKRSAQCYIGRGVTGVQAAVESEAKSLGLVAVTHTDGEVLSVELAEYINAPKRFETTVDSVRMYAELPHIEYDQSNLRGKSYILAIDRTHGGIEVETSEQLLSVALCGDRPLPKAESAAEYIYSAARNILLGIIGYDYDDEQKIHAVYDWLQWSTSHSNSTEKDICGRFLEGVFGSETLGVSVAASPSVTSEGMAKAFAFMCRMEGIESDIVRAYKNGRVYYFNSVTLGRVPYYVDVYGGEIESAELGIARRSEMTSHRGLFMTTAAARALGIDTSSLDIDAFDRSRSAYLKKSAYNGVYFDYYIENAELGKGSIEAAVFAAFSSVPSGSVSIITVGSIATYPNITLGVELYLGEGVFGTSLQKVIDEIEDAVDAYAEETYGKPFPNNGVAVYILGNTVHIAATSIM